MLAGSWPQSIIEDTASTNTAGYKVIKQASLLQPTRHGVSPRAVFQVPIWKHGLVLQSTKQCFQRKNETMATGNERGAVDGSPMLIKKDWAATTREMQSGEGQKDETTARLSPLPMGSVRVGFAIGSGNTSIWPHRWAPSQNKYNSITIFPHGGLWACASLTGGGRDAVGQACAWAARRRHAGWCDE